MNEAAAIRALRACRAWHICEDKSLGTFQARMELCQLAEYLVRVALGDTSEGYKGVPRIVIGEGLNVQRIRATEDEAWSLVEQAEALIIEEEPERLPEQPYYTPTRERDRENAGTGMGGKS